MKYMVICVGFNHGDETQFEVSSLEELYECWYTFCEENEIDEDSIDYVETLYVYRKGV